MAARARIEWVTLGEGRSLNGSAHNIIQRLHGSAVILAVTTAPTAGAARPAAPDFGSRASGYALVRCLGGSDNPVAVAWGEDPVASETNGKLVEPGEEVPVFCEAGTLFSLVEIA
ncbi:hypothetical protein [Microvirga lenta]|uniref:hypothetical protein n=1 Tax=Microvirga lenta TaxID=2881337 RepID=UPI001CFF5C7F|nr:hypothetical protein [Microvirga lenta]MCB5176300.1 hypothetical protein [Microvirga lenta]